jgi:hypothetical protein
MYWRDEGEKEEAFKAEIMAYFEKYKRSNTGYIVSSSHSDFTNGDGDNPPHKKARDRYEQIVKPGRLVCTHEYPSKTDPRPIIFTVGKDGFEFEDQRAQSQGPARLASAIASARGGSQPPGVHIGFGNLR